MAIKRGLDKCTAALVKELAGISTTVQGRDQMAQVATISANDREIGDMLADVLDQVGAEGVVTIEEGKGIESETELVEGMNFDRGYISPYFVTNPERMEAVIENPHILVTDKKISSAAELVPVLESALQVTRNLLVIAEDVDGEGLGRSRGQQASRYHQLPGRQGPGLRRPPQGYAGRHRNPHRRRSGVGGAGPQARPGLRR